MNELDERNASAARDADQLIDRYLASGRQVTDASSDFNKPEQLLAGVSQSVYGQGVVLPQSSITPQMRQAATELMRDRQVVSGARSLTPDAQLAKLRQLEQLMKGANGGESAGSAGSSGAAAGPGNRVARLLNRLVTPRDTDTSADSDDESGTSPKDKAKPGNAAAKQVENAAKKEVQAVEKKVAEAAAKKAGVAIAADVVAPEIAIPAQVIMLAWKYKKWVLVVFLISVMLSLGAVAAALGIGQTGVFGSSFHISSNNDDQLLALANAGDAFARRTLDARTIQSIKNALDQVEQKAKAKADTAALDIINTVRNRISTYTSTDSKVDLQSLHDIVQGLRQLSALGYGNSVTVAGAGPAYTTVAQLISSGKLVIAQPNDRDGLLNNGLVKRAIGPSETVQTNPMIPLLLVALNDAGFGPITVSSIIGHHLESYGDVKHSPHWDGNGMDISIIKSQDVKSHHDVARQMLQWILDHQNDLKTNGVIVQQTIGPAEFGALQLRHGNQVTSAGDGYLHNHEDHVHFGFAGISHD